jgi:hypothetical protein
MVMFFFDEAGELEEYQLFKKKDQPLELVHLKVRKALQEAHAALKADPQNAELKARVTALEDRLAALERQAPWLALDYPLEYLLWGPPHG